MISILNDYYEFPNQIELKYRLKDFLEKEVDEKYYLSDKMINYIVADNEKWTGNNGQSLINREIGCTINTAPTQRRCDASNYVAPEINGGGQIDLKEYLKDNFPNNKMSGGGLPIKNATETGYLLAEEGDGINICGRMEYQRGNVQKGLALTINTKGTDGGVCVKNEQETEKSDPKS